VNKNQKKFFKLVEEERERQDTLWGLYLDRHFNVRNWRFT
jgi:hypothetical protein